MWKLTDVKPSCAAENSQSSPQRVEAKALLTPGMPPQEAEFVSAKAMGRWRCWAAATQLRAASLKRVISSGASSSSAVTRRPSHTVLAYSWTVTSLRVEAPTPSRKAPRSCGLRQRQQIAGPITGYLLAVALFLNVSE